MKGSQRPRNTRIREIQQKCLRVFRHGLSARRKHCMAASLGHHNGKLSNQDILYYAGKRKGGVPRNFFDFIVRSAHSKLTFAGLRSRCPAVCKFYLALAIYHVSKVSLEYPVCAQSSDHLSRFFEEFNCMTIHFNGVTKSGETEGKKGF